MTIQPFRTALAAACMALLTTSVALAQTDTAAPPAAAPSMAADAAVQPPVAATVTTDPVAEREPGVPDPAIAHPELRAAFEAFGGMPGLTALTEEFMTVMLADPRMRPFFVDADQTRVKRQLAEQFCVILGGDCTYSGRDMKSSHTSIGVDKADFNALVEDLQIAMQRRKIPFRAQNKLLAQLAPMHREVINR